MTSILSDIKVQKYGIVYLLTSKIMLPKRNSKSLLKHGMALNAAVYCVIKFQNNLEYLKCIYFIFVSMHIIS